MENERFDGILYTFCDGKYYVSSYEEGIETALIRLTVNTFPVCGILEDAFRDCPTLRNIVFTDFSKGTESLVDGFEIGDYAFAGCTSLTEINLPECVTSIGSGAFYSCTSLVKAILPNSYVGPYAFYGCTALLYVSPLSNIAEGVFSHCKSLKNIDISVSVSEIDEDAFEHCESLVSVQIPASVKMVGALAFRGCLAIKEIVFLDPDGWYSHNTYTDSESSINLDDPSVNAIALSRMDFDDGVTAWYKK